MPHPNLQSRERRGFKIVKPAMTHADTILSGVGQMRSQRVGVTVEKPVRDMIDLEASVAEALNGFTPRVKGHVEATSALKSIKIVTTKQSEALRARLLKLREDSGSLRRAASARRTEGRSRERDMLSVSAALRGLQGLVHEAAFGYAMLHAVAHRFYDSKEEGNTADLAEEHLRAYAKVSQALNRLISDVVVWELSEAGQECHCQCPSCSLGVCLCSPHGTNTVTDIWRETDSLPLEQVGSGMRVRPPRQNSAARLAGLRSGDVVVAIDDREIRDEGWDSISALQGAIKEHPSGDIVRFRVRRASREIEDLSAVRP